MYYTDNLKLGDLVAIAHQNSFTLGMFIEVISNNNCCKAYYRWLPYYHQRGEWITTKIEKLEAGETQPGQVDYINSGANFRILPISESLLTEPQARYLKFYRSKLNLHEYQDNRPGYSL